jgi:hypothetical protein
MDRRSKRKARQLALTEREQLVPSWATLPEECRREVVALLARLLRSEAVAGDEEVHDE